MGQFRPTQQHRLELGKRGLGLLAPDLLTFSIGFVLASVGAFAAAYGLGGGVSALLAESTRRSIVIVVLLLLAVTDVARLWRGASCAIGLKRQTPRQWGWSPVGVFAWGLDTGIPFTTVRATSLPFMAMAAVLLGFGAVWGGVLYAAGFLGLLWILCSVRPSRRSTEEGESEGVDPSERLVASLMRHDRLARLSAVMIAITAGGSALLVG